MALPAAPHRRVDRLGVTAVDPELVRQVWRTQIGFAFGVVTMAGDAISGEDGLADLDFRRWYVLCDSRVGKAAHVTHDVVDFVLFEHPIATECHHLRCPALRMGGIDTDADRFGDAFRIATPKP